MNWKTIFNPFEKFDEKPLLLFGIAITLIGSFFGFFFQVSYDGVLDAHQNSVTFIGSLKENTVNIFSIFVVLLVLGKIINRRTRIIDILNTSLVSRLPIYLTATFVNNPAMEKVANQVLENKDNLQNFQFNPTDLVVIMGISMVMMVLLCYFIVFLVNGFRTATNVKKWQHFVLFAIAIVVAEIISKFLIYNLIS